MKKLSIYKKDNEFIVERTNEFNHATKRVFVSREGLFEYLEANKNLFELHELEVSTDLWGKVINFISTGEVPSGHGGKREGAGRPSLGTTKKVSITLNDDTWKKIDDTVEENDISKSALLREIIENYFEEE